jgi:hypothetical protein
MKGKKLLYLFGDPFGADESKIGITGHPAVRFGVYQNSYSRNSHVARFDVVYIGPARAIENLERVIKQEFNWEIERDGRGHSEWISQNFKAIEPKIDQLIEGYKFKVTKVSKQYLPLTTDNLEKLLLNFQLI